jgi:hypothetical protein
MSEKPATKKVYRRNAVCFMRLRILYLQLAERYGHEVALSALIDLTNISSLK